MDKGFFSNKPNENKGNDEKKILKNRNRLMNNYFSRILFNYLSFTINLLIILKTIILALISVILHYL
jgi:hypothetical protein